MAIPPTGYRFYLLDDGDHIAAVRVCECTNDADAFLEADAAGPNLTVTQRSQFVFVRP
jgi:hypothetical protein